MSGVTRQKTLKVPARLLRRLFSSDPNVRADATRELAQFPPAAVPGILEQANLLNIQRYLCIGGLTAFAVFITSLLFANSPEELSLAMRGCSLVLAVVGGHFMFNGVDPGRVYLCIGDAVEHQESPFAIPTLLTLIGPAHLRSKWNELPDETRQSFCTTLRRLLPKMDESHYERLSTSQKNTLLDLVFLASYTDPFLCIQIVELTGRLGDPKNQEIRRICRLLANKEVWICHKQLPVTARAALAELDRRAERERLSETLLRPSNGSAHPAEDTHLRPAAAPGKTRDEELLRPSKPEVGL